MFIHERLHALAASSEPDAARELTECADAARDMLTALRGLLDWGRDNTSPRDPSGPHALLIAAAAAIAKARGEA